MRRWIVVCEAYEGIEAKAVDLLTAEINKYVDYSIPVLIADRKEMEKFNGDSKVILKTGNVAGGAEDGYLIEVKAEGDINVVEITANDKRGLYYGVVDFISVYVAKSAVTVYPNINLKGMFDTPFNCPMPEYRLERAPKIKNRAIWTWGHCILDYKKFIENMSLLKLNEIVVWNDYLPVNAKEFVDCAHAYGIKVVWGFSWGWDTKCCKTDIRSLVGEEKTQAFANKILSYYETELLPTGCDGIYFQSFTELTTDNIDGVNVAEAVTDLVNTVAAKLYEKYPLLEIQFGLHATSVFENLSKIRKVDKRIKIVWEDCGSFPFSYSPADVGCFDKTSAFAEATAKLRGEKEKVGYVYKGMTTLYWYGVKPCGGEDGVYEVFEHIKGRFVLGKSDEKEIDALYREKKPYWRFIQSQWIKNAHYVTEMTKTLAHKGGADTDVQLLVENGAFEKEINFAVAFAAETFWSDGESSSEIIERIMLNPNVRFA